MNYSSNKSGKLSQSDTSFLSTSNTQLAQKHKLGFMMDSSGEVQNPRVSIPSAKSIIDFNESKRKKTFTTGGLGGDMTTETAKRVKKAKYKLQEKQASRNHKLSDNIGGDLVNRALILGRSGQKKDRDELKRGFKEFSDAMYDPIDKPTKAQQKKQDTMLSDFNRIIDPSNTLTSSEFQKGLKRIKTGLTSVQTNLRIGDSSLNSGIGSSFDPNLTSSNGPPSPISKSLQTATFNFVSMPQMQLSKSQQTSITSTATSGGKSIGSSNL